MAVKNGKKIVNGYIKWMFAKTKGSVPIDVMQALHGIEFTWSLPMDKNRAADGIALRNRFIFEAVYSDDVKQYLDGPCSVLEMLFALALRLEESTMRDPEKGDRTGKWFAIMVDNLGILDHRDELYSRVEKFLRRDYLPNGNGNIFYIPDSPDDLRYVEIWQQTMRFAKEYYE